MRRIPLFSSLVLAFLAACSDAGFHQSSSPQRTTQGDRRTSIEFRLPRIPAGTNVTVRLLEAVSSRSAKLGEQFAAELLSSVIIAGKVAFPKGTRVRGHVADVRRSTAGGGLGYLRITLDGIQTLDGRWVDMDTTSVSSRGEKFRNGTENLPPASGTSFGRPEPQDGNAIVSSNRKLQFAVREDIVMAR